MGRPLSAAHKAAISAALKRRHAGQRAAKPTKQKQLLGDRLRQRRAQARALAHAARAAAASRKRKARLSKLAAAAHERSKKFIKS